MATHTVIIGNGIAGVTTARHLRKNDASAKITIISGETPHFFSRTALMYVYMGHMAFENIKPYQDFFWDKNRISLLQKWVTHIEFAEKAIHFKDCQPIKYDQLVLATGSKSSYFGWPGQDLDGVQGLVSYQDLQQLEASTPAPGQKNHPCKHAVIVGGGLIGIELAEMLLTRNVAVTMLVREKAFWNNVITPNEAHRIALHAQSHGLNLRLAEELDEILGDEKGHVKGLRTKAGETIDCQLVGITTGVRPNVEFLKDSGLEIKQGIVVNGYLETKYPDVYAAGDCVEITDPHPGRRATEPVWYTGRMMGEVLGATLAGKRTPYHPGPWFNSAKFFDIEYQTYGEVRPTPGHDQAQWFGEMPGPNRFVTIAYNPDNHLFQGINAFGMRMRHAYFDTALRKGLGVDEVVGGIEAANFDAEFYRKWPKDLKAAFSRDTGIALKQRNAFQKLFSK
jgi:NAD(P)H-nitrite reductase large subunit